MLQNCISSSIFSLVNPSLIFKVMIDRRIFSDSVGSRLVLFFLYLKLKRSCYLFKSYFFLSNQIACQLSTEVNFIPLLLAFSLTMRFPPSLKLPILLHHKERVILFYFVVVKTTLLDHNGGYSVIYSLMFHIYEILLLIQLRKRILFIPFLLAFDGAYLFLSLMCQPYFITMKEWFFLFLFSNHSSCILIQLRKCFLFMVGLSRLNVLLSSEWSFINHLWAPLLGESWQLQVTHIL